MLFFSGHLGFHAFCVCVLCLCFVVLFYGALNFDSEISADKIQIYSRTFFRVFPVFLIFGRCYFVVFFSRQILN